jgi:anaerobic selenocysteine-containing dehydrogenase
LADVHRVRTYCRICIATCGLVAETDGVEILSLRGDRDHPVSEGYVCPKGRGLAALHTHPDRINYPLMRIGDSLREVSWPVVLDDAASRIREVIKEFGPGAVNLFMGAGTYTEAAGYLAARRLARALRLPGFYSDITIDSPNKPVVAALMSGWNGLAAKIDQDDAKMLVVVGCNPIVSHGHTAAIPNPIEFLRRMRDRGCEVWVVDPRRTETARIASGHLAPRPGTDYAIFAHALRELLSEGADEEYVSHNTVGRADLEAAVAPFTSAYASSVCGVPENDLCSFVGAVRRAGRFAFETGTGVSMSAGANVTEWLVWALALVTGSVEQPGGVWFNPGYLGRFDERSIKGVSFNPEPEPGPPSRPDLPTWFGEYPSVALVDEIESGNLRALIDLGGNLVTCLPDTNRVVPALKKLDVLVVFEIARTPTTDLATHVFPCRDQLERPDLPFVFDRAVGTIYTQYTPAVVTPKAERRPMWWSLAQLAARLDLSVLPAGLDPDTATDDDVLRPLAAKSATSFDDLVAIGGPVLGPRSVFGWVREHVVRPEGWDLCPRVLAEQLKVMRPPEALVMINMRQPRKMNGQVQAARISDRFEILVHPDEAPPAGVVDGAEVIVRSQAGELVGTVRFDDEIARGVVAIPHGWTNANVNVLISASLDIDPVTGMARLSGTPVTLRPA